MAKQRHDGIRGSFGNLTARVVRGVTIISKKRETPSKRTQKRRRTIGQLKQRARFKVASQFASELKELFNLSFETVGSQIGKCQAISYLTTTAVQGEYPNYSIDYSKALVARGRALPALGASATLGDDSILFKWEDNSSSAATASDQAILVAWCPQDEWEFYTITGGERRSCEGSLKIAAHKGNEYHTWISFMKKNGQAADSVYAGVLKME
jgi:hypothetical protein